MSARDSAPRAQGAATSAHERSVAPRAPRIALVVPACDEAPRIGRVISSVPSSIAAIVLVDDGSRDGTVAHARAIGDRRLSVVSHSLRRGVGRAIETGYRRAFADGADVAVVAAGDAQMDPGDLPALLAPVLGGQAGYAKGNRLAHPDVRRAMGPVRWAGSVGLSLLTRGASGLPVWDSQCGYTAISSAAWRAIATGSSWGGYGYPNDLLVRLARARVPVVDVVVRPIYVDKQGGMGVRHALFLVPFVLGRAVLREG